MDWWTNAETFHATSLAINPGQNGQFDWATLAESKCTFTTHCPIDKNFIDRCHALGIRCFPYVTFYMGANQCQFGPISSNTYNGVDFSQHPEFIERDQQQQPKAWAFTSTTPDGDGVTFKDLPFLVCPNYEPFQVKMEQWVDYIMKQGADGVFVDVLTKRTHCYAPHKHIYPNNPADPDAAQNQAFALLLSRVRGVVKSHKKDGLVIGNSGDPLNLVGVSSPLFQQYLDADTIESYICMGTLRLPLYYNLIPWDDFGQKLQAYLAKGKQILVIPALGDSPQFSFRDNAFLTYCAARIAGLTWYGGPMNDPRLADLHRLRLGKPVIAESTDPGSGVKYRVFERGLVAVNWDQSNAKPLAAQKLTAAAMGAAPPAFQFFYDLFTWPGFNVLDAAATSGLLQIPAYSGRVFLFGSTTDYGLNRLTPAIVKPPIPTPGVHPPHVPPAGGGLPNKIS